MANKKISDLTAATTPLDFTEIVPLLQGGDNVQTPVSSLFIDSGVYAFLSAQADTTITTAETYYPILGTFTNDPIENFTAATVYMPGIKYTGVQSRHFKIEWCASLSANAASTTVRFGIKKNGALITGSIMSTLCKTAGETYAISGICVVELDTNDEIQLVITSNGDGDVVTMIQYTTAIGKFFY